MNSTVATLTTDLTTEPRFKTYLKAFGFAFPALLTWQFVNLFILPKFMVIQSDFGLHDAQLFNLMTPSRWFANYGMTALVFIAGTLLVMEWRSRFLPRYRKAMLGAFVFLINTSVLVQLATLLIAAALLMPMLGHR